MAMGCTGGGGGGEKRWWKDEENGWATHQAKRPNEAEGSSGSWEEIYCTRTHLRDPPHQGIMGNKKADEHARTAAEKSAPLDEVPDEYR